MADQNIVDRLVNSFSLCRSFFDVNIEDLRRLLEGPTTFLREGATNGHNGEGDLHVSLRAGIAMQLDGMARHLDELAGHLDGIVKHATAVRDFKSQVNTLSPISRLPPEVLSEIFLSHKDLHASSARDATAWKSVAHVCRHWRMVALKCSTLWTSIRLSAKEDHITEYLARSKRAPLSIQEAVLPSLETGHVLSSAISRVENLCLTIYRGTSQETMVMESAPFLRSLVLNTPTRHRVSDTVILCSNVLYGEAAPRLQQLTLTSLPFEWHPGFRHSNMKDLRIYLSRATTSTLESLTSALDAMPLLEVLVLQRCLPLDIQPSRHWDHVVALRHLRSIAIVGNSMGSANLLTHLDFPSDASIRLGSYLASAPPFESLQVCVTRFIEAYPLQHLTVLNGMTTFQFVPVGGRTENGNTDHTDLKVVRTLPELIIFFPYDAFSTVCEHLPLYGVVELTISDSYRQAFRRDRITTLAQGFTKMPNIQILHARNMNTKFGPVPVESEIERSDPFVLLQLRELILEHALLDPPDVPRLIGYLKKRHECGLGLETVIFLKSLVVEDQRRDIMPQIQKFVKTVIWDPPRPENFDAYMVTGLSIPLSPNLRLINSRSIKNCVPIIEPSHLHILRQH